MIYNFVLNINVLFVLLQVVNYFNERNSIVYIVSFGASKAFDRVKPNKLFSALFSNNFPSCCIKLIINWYFKRSVSIRWNGFYSRACNVYNGVRQGSVLSRMIFNLYDNKIITCLTTSVAGCYFVICYVSYVMHTDELLLLSGSVLGAHAMLDTYGCIGKTTRYSF